MAHNRFRRGHSVFTCAICKRRTRETEQPGESGLCFECWELAGWDNSVNDGGSTVEEIASTRDALLAQAVKRGGNEALIRAAFDYLFPTT